MKKSKYTEEQIAFALRQAQTGTRDDARAAMFEYIEMFYNPKRRHTHNGRVAPTVYEQRYFKQTVGV